MKHVKVNGKYAYLQERNEYGLINSFYTFLRAVVIRNIMLDCSTIL